LLTVASADACPVYIEPKLSDARQADAVVVGYVTKDVRATDRARLTVEINHIIAGTVPSAVTVYWYREINNGPPERISGGYVFALRKLPPSMSADGVDAYAVMQGVCSGALVFRRGSTQANAIREMFGLEPEPLEPPPETFVESFKAALISGPALIVFGLLTTGATFTGVALWRRRRRPRGQP
tara:strand:+ start:254602 stop:255150 length:549 start_codon:yes stop_codon:yes gene_type:complete